MSAERYNERQLSSGELSAKHVTTLVEYWQRGHNLAVDGYAGANTIASLSVVPAIEKIWPLLLLPDGRPPKITSGFYTENGSRPTHKGIDLFYEWLDTDPAVPVGDGGAIMRKGERRWWYPPGTYAVAAAAGVVMTASEIGTGWRVWVDHGNGERTGYFHGKQLAAGLGVGSVVAMGAALILVGDNPKGHDAKHLHFEVSPVNEYAPMNPRKWLEEAAFRCAA